MRTETDIVKLVSDYVKNDDRVRMLLLNGSRVNNSVITDKLSDYDFMFLVNEPMEFWNNKNWVEVFGDILIARSCNWSDNNRERYFFLTIYKDYVRIDIQVFNITQVDYCVKKSSLTEVILDKDNLAPQINSPSDKSHYVKKPTLEEFNEVVDDFFGFSTCAAKSLHRKELPKVKYYFDYLIHQNCINNLLSWYVGVTENWNVNVGSNGRWLEKHLPSTIWEKYIGTFAGNAYEDIWKALWIAIELVEEIIEYLSHKMDYSYSTSMVIGVKRFLNIVYNQQLEEL